VKLLIYDETSVCKWKISERNEEYENLRNVRRLNKQKWPISGRRLCCAEMLDAGISLTWWLSDSIIISSVSSSSSSSMMRRSAAMEEFT